MTYGSDLIAQERERQISEEGYDAEHDKEHADDLMRAADSYLQFSFVRREFPDKDIEFFNHPSDIGVWPWDREYWKPTGDTIRDLTKAGALIAAAIDSLQKDEE